MKDEATQTGSNTKSDTSDNTATKQPRKIELALYWLLTKGANGLVQPEAHTLYRESALHTTISSLKHEKGIHCISKPDLETIVYQYQKPFHRYWLEADKDRVKAINLLNYYRAKRGLEKIYFPAWHESSDKAA